MQPGNIEPQPLIEVSSVLGTQLQLEEPSLLQSAELASSTQCAKESRKEKHRQAVQKLRATQSILQKDIIRSQDAAAKRLSRQSALSSRNSVVQATREEKNRQKVQKFRFNQTVAPLA